MGLNATYRAVTDDDLTALALMPPEEVNESIQDSYDSRWGSNPSGDIGTMWHALHFVLTGYPDSTLIDDIPLSCAVLGASEEFDAGDGYVTVVGSHEVAGLLAALRDVDRAQLARSVDPAQLAEEDIYPVHAWRADERGALAEQLVDALDSLVVFYAQTQARGLGALVTIW